MPSLIKSFIMKKKGFFCKVAILHHFLRVARYLFNHKNKKLTNTYLYVQVLISNKFNLVTPSACRVDYFSKTKKKQMVRPRGFEPRTSSLKVRRSNQLS